MEAAADGNGNFRFCPLPPAPFDAVVVAVGRTICPRLTGLQAVLRRLLKAHPDLSSEAYEIARSLLRQLEYGDVAAGIEDEIRALDYEDLNARAGGHKWGYDMKRHIELGLEAEALEICKGMVLGLYRLSERQGGDVLGWAPDFPAEAAGNALEFCHAGAGEPKSRGIRQETRPPLSQDFLSMVPKWIPMIERILKEAK